MTNDDSYLLSGNSLEETVDLYMRYKFDDVFAETSKDERIADIDLTIQKLLQTIDNLTEKRRELLLSITIENEKKKTTVRANFIKENTEASTTCKPTYRIKKKIQQEIK